MELLVNSLICFGYACVAGAFGFLWCEFIRRISLIDNKEQGDKNEDTN